MKHRIYKTVTHRELLLYDDVAFGLEENYICRAVLGISKKTHNAFIKYGTTNSTGIFPRLVITYE